MKKNQKILIITILIIFGITFVTQATDITNLENQASEINTQIDETNSELTEVRTQMSELMLELQELNEEIEKYESEITSLMQETNTLKESVNALEISLEASQKSYNIQKQLLESRLVALYEAGETKYLDVLLSSTGISDFISNYYLLSELAQYDSEMLEDIEKEKNAIEEQKTSLEEQRERLKTVKNSKERTAIVLENTQVLKNTYMSQLTEEEKNLQSKIDEYNEQIKEIESEIVLLTTVNLSADYKGGIMMWPVPGYSRITSEFGMRVHPITGINKLHTGIDIGAPTGANFVAAADGVVVKAGKNVAYGNMVIINHGGGVSTLYAHGSEILVTLGQEVKKGEPILKVGSTGYSTGPHAHFEVRINGKYVQPLNFLKQ